MKSSIIKVYLDQLFRVTQIDPTSVSPDEFLGRDLGISKDAIETVIFETAHQLSIEFKPVIFDDMTSRQIVYHLSQSQGVALAPAV